jgi:response regulator of citrate/malate metabolism
MEKINGVLLIDDDPVSNFLHAQIIRSIDFCEDVFIMKNGEEALYFLSELEKTNKPSPELLFLDIHMPVIDGFEFMEEFKKMSFINSNLVRVVILATTSYYKDIEKFKIMNIDEFIVKPLTNDKLKYLLNIEQ